MNAAKFEKKNPQDAQTIDVMPPRAPLVLPAIASMYTRSHFNSTLDRSSIGHTLIPMHDRDQESNLGTPAAKYCCYCCSSSKSKSIKFETAARFQDEIVFSTTDALAALLSPYARP